LLAGDLFRGRLRFPFGALCLLSIGTIVLSLVANSERVILSKGPVGAAAEIPKNLVVWLHFYLLVNLMRTRRQFLLALRAWLLAAVIDSLLGIGGSLAYQFAGIETSFSLMFRAQGTLADANLFAAHLVVSFLLAVLYCRLTGKYHFWFIPATLIFAAGIFLSASRGSTMTFCICVALLCLLNSSWQVKVGFVACLGVLGLLLSLAPMGGAETSNPIFSRLGTTTVSLDDQGAADRKRLWDSAWQEFSDSPVFGVGRGNFVPLDEPDITKTGQIHNTYLGLLCEIGVPGFLAMITFFLRYPIRLAGWPVHHPALRIPTRVVLLSFLAIALCGITICIENYRGLWVLIALAEGYERLYLRVIV
jgi:O-antigen ligase